MIDQLYITSIVSHSRVPSNTIGRSSVTLKVNMAITIGNLYHVTQQCRNKVFVLGAKGTKTTGK